MNRLKDTKNRLKLRKNRVRSTVTGTSDRPRLSVKVSLSHVSAQLIDDSKHHTLASATSVGQKNLAKASQTEKAEWVGTEVAKKAKLKKVKMVVFDRNGKKFHGRVKALADAARKAGLEF